MSVMMMTNGSVSLPVVGGPLTNVHRVQVAERPYGRATAWCKQVTERHYGTAWCTQVTERHHGRATAWCKLGDRPMACVSAVLHGREKKAVVLRVDRYRWRTSTSTFLCPKASMGDTADGGKMWGSQVDHLEDGQVSLSQMEEAREKMKKPQESVLRRERWDILTEQLTACSTLPFLLLMLPQIIKNARSLIAGNRSPLSILPWMGYTTGLFGNMLLLSYFSEKKETGATTVQAVGVVSTFLLLSQVFLAGYMPVWAFSGLSAVVILGLTINYLNFIRALPHSYWVIWQEAIGVGGLMVLPQVIFWSVFPANKSFFPGLIAGSVGFLFIILSRSGRLSEDVRGIWAQLSGWTATVLFMFMPVAQLISNFRNPEGMAGMSVLMVLLGLIGNALMIPRALFTQDIIWLTGCTWGTMMMGWGNLLCMYTCNRITKVFWGFTASLAAYLAFVVVENAKSHGLSSPSMYLRFSQSSNTEERVESQIQASSFDEVN